MGAVKGGWTEEGERKEKDKRGKKEKNMIEKRQKTRSVEGQGQRISGTVGAAKRDQTIESAACDL